MFCRYDWDGGGTSDVDKFAQSICHLRDDGRNLHVFREFRSLNRELVQLSVREVRQLAIHPRQLSVEEA